MPNEIGDAFYVGYEEILGPSWWKGDGTTEGKHFPRAVPIQDVMELIGFDVKWERLPYQFASDGLAPLMAIHPTRTIEVSEGVFEPALLGVNGWQYPMTDYYERLILGASAITDQSAGELQIGSCGILSHGRKAFIQIALDEPMKHSSGEEYQPWLVAYSSLDGSFANTFILCFIRVVCRNTFQLGRRQATAKYSFRNTKNGALDVLKARTVLDMFADMGTDLWAEIDGLLDVPVTEPKVEEILEIVWPLKPDGLSKTAVTKRTNIRADFMSIYTTDPRVRDFTGTAYGVLQAGNTLWQHGTELEPVAIDKRQTKHGRTMSWLMNGETAQKDDVMRDAIAKVLKPKILVATN